MLRRVRSHGLDIDAHQRAELQLWLVHKRFAWHIYVLVYARAETDSVPSSTDVFTNLFSSIIISERSGQRKLSLDWIELSVTSSISSDWAIIIETD